MNLCHCDQSPFRTQPAVPRPAKAPPSEVILDPLEVGQKSLQIRQPASETQRLRGEILQWLDPKQRTTGAYLKQTGSTPIHILYYSFKKKTLISYVYYIYIHITIWL